MANIPDTNDVNVAYVAAALEIARIAVTERASAYHNTNNSDERTKILTNAFLKALKAISERKEIA
jgi:hypothetical protein